MYFDFIAPTPLLESPWQRCRYYQYQPVGCRIRLAGLSLPAKDAGTMGGAVGASCPHNLAAGGTTPQLEGKFSQNISFYLFKI